MAGLWKTWRDRRRCPCSQRSDRLVGSRDEHRRQRDLATPRLRGSRRPGLARAVDPSSGCTAGLWPAHSLVVCAKARGWRDDRRWGSRGRGSASLPCRATRYPVGAKRDRSRAATGHPGGILGERVAPFTAPATPGPDRLPSSCDRACASASTRADSNRRSRFQWSSPRRSSRSSSRRAGLYKYVRATVASVELIPLPRARPARVRGRDSCQFFAAFLPGKYIVERF
jgi:hypothetical protein